MSNPKNRLDELYQKSTQFNDDIPSDLAKKIVVYAEILRIIGVYISHASYNLANLETERKREHALALIHEVGTAKEKEGKAELRISKIRKKENNAERELIKWKNNFIATQELINALKKQLEVLMMEWGGSGNR